MSKATDKFDYSIVNSDLVTLQTAYEDFYKAMQRIDVKINTAFQIPDGGCLYGIKGGDFLKEWNDKCAGFKNYYYLFKNWTNKVIEIGKEFGVVAASVYGENGKAVSFDPIKENVEHTDISSARILTALLLGIDEIDGQKIETVFIDDKEYAIIGDNKYLINRDEAGNITKITIDGETKNIDNRTVEERVGDQYKAYKAGEMSQEEWNKFYNSLDEEAQLYVSYLETGATIYDSRQIESLLKDYASASLSLTGADSMFVYKNDIVISTDGMPYEFMGLSIVEFGYYNRKPYPVFRALNDGIDKSSYDGWKTSNAYIYANGEFVKIDGNVGSYVLDDYNQGPTAVSFDNGSGPAKVIRSNNEIPEGAILTIHQYGTPDINDGNVVIAEGKDFFQKLESNAADWTSLPKVIYIPEGNKVHIDSGLPFGIFSENVTSKDGQGFFMIRDDNSYSYWYLYNDGTYYEFKGNDERIPYGSFGRTTLE